MEGSLFFIRSQDFLKIGMFDENLFMYGEEEVLAYKLERINKKIGVCIKIKFIHHHAHRSEFYRNKKLLDIYHKHNISRQSQIYVFRNYVTQNKFYWLLYSILSCLDMLKSILAEKIKSPA